MRPLGYLFALCLATVTLQAATLPGFEVETIATGDGFVSSLVTDSKGTIYFTTTNGWIHRVAGNTSTKVASLPTRAGGNGGLLGMAMFDDNTAVVHYTTWNDQTGDDARVLDDVVSLVDLRNGAETVLRAFVCDITNREHGASSEHHGGNPTVAPDGSIFVGIGDYGGYAIAQKPEWNAGKLWRLDRYGNALQWARGLRNPYDLVWDPDRGRVIVSDNGTEAGDEIHVAGAGADCGWPNTQGNQPPAEGAVPPAYVFPDTVAPTGLHRLAGANPALKRGFLSAAFVTRAIYYLPPSLADAVPLLKGFGQFVLDVTEAPNGDVLFATAAGPTSSIHRLRVPRRGDCNADGSTDSRDVTALERELEDGPSQSVMRAHEGAHEGSWSCDANSDGVIDNADIPALRAMLRHRRRSVRSR
jgi:glucose/arabinose dehydrogenase